MQLITMTNLNSLLFGEIFRCHEKFPTAWIPIEMIRFHFCDLKKYPETSTEKNKTI